MATTFKLKWYGDNAKQNVRDTAIEGLRDGGEVVLDASNQRAPIDEGTLINSGQVTVDEDTLEAVITYDEPYAIRQHEDLTLQHRNGRQPKFLESALTENQDAVLQNIADRIKEALK